MGPSPDFYPLADGVKAKFESGVKLFPFDEM